MPRPPVDCKWSELQHWLDTADPSELYELDPDRPDVSGAVLVQALDGFIDAGGARKLASQHLLDTLDSTVVARFDHDQLFDYRARRPIMVFAKDHWESYDTPQLALLLLHDLAGKPFLGNIGAFAVGDILIALCITLREFGLGWLDLKLQTHGP